MSRTFNRQSSQPVMRDPYYGVTFDWGTTVPADASVGYAPGCIFLQVDGAQGSQLYINEGTNTSSDFNVFALGGIDLSGLTASAAEINQYADESAKTEIVITTNVLAASESGKTMFLDLVDGFQTTLPAPALGLNFRFVVKTSPTTAYTVVTSGSSNILCGQVLTLDVNSATDPSFTATADQDRLNFVASKAVKGDWAEFWCDGTSWYVRASASVFDGITIDQASA